MNRKQFLKSLGLFMILPGAGRVWRARRYMRFYAVEELGLLPQFHNKMIQVFYMRQSPLIEAWTASLPPFQDFINSKQLTQNEITAIHQDDRLIHDLAKRRADMES